MKEPEKERVACFSVLHSISFWITDSNCFTNHTSFLPSFHPSCLPVLFSAGAPACLSSRPLSLLLYCHPSLHLSLPACLPTVPPSFSAWLSGFLSSLLPCFLIREGGITPGPLLNLEGQKMLAAKDQSSMDYLPGLEVQGGIVLLVIESWKPVKALFSGWNWLKTYRLLCWQGFSVLATS